MKFIKRVFSKTLVIFLLCLLQLALIVTTAYRLDIFPVVRLISIALTLPVFLVIVNKKECPEFKLPWLVLLFLLPVFTVMAYLLFANPKMRKKDQRRLLAIQAQTRRHTDRNRPDIEEALGENAGIGRYLEAHNQLHGHVGSRVTYYRVGEECWVDLLSELEKAEKYIFMEYFIIEEGQMWDSIHEILVRKASQGVEVRLIYDDIGSVGTVKGGFDKELRKEGIDCRRFNPFRPIISGVYNNRDHRKITVIDGKVGFTGGINLGDEYINRDDRLGHWKDTAIRIEGSAVDNLLALFLGVFDMMAKKPPQDYDTYFAEQHTYFADGGYVHPFGDGPKPVYNEQIGENNYINLINAAKHYCYITTPYLILDHNLTCALRNAAYRGVDVRIITPHIPDKKTIFAMTRSNYPYLLAAGVRIYEYTPGFVHAKMLLADDQMAFVGTINLDYRSLVHHYECGAVLYGTPCLADIKQDFEQTLARSEEITAENFRMGKFEALKCAVFNLFSPML